MNASCLDFHKDENEWMQEDLEFFDCLEERLSHLLNLSYEESQKFLGDA